MELLDMLAVGFSLSAVLCYALALTCIGLERRSGGLLNKFPYAKFVFAGMAWLFNLGLFIENWVVNGYAPFASMYQVLGAISLSFMLMYVLLRLLYKQLDWLFGYFCAAASIPLIGTIFMDRQMEWSMMPALRSPYFVPHVFSYVASYALFAVAFCLTLICLFSDKKQKYLDAIYCVALLALPFMTAGLLLGALWADDVWGNFWQWDVKEVWSLITYLLYLAYFHVRRVAKDPRWQYVFLILGFVSVVITFLFVNVFKTDSLHAYT